MPLDGRVASAYGRRMTGSRAFVGLLVAVLLAGCAGLDGRAAGDHGIGVTGTGRVAWRAGSALPVVQCVRVRRDGPLTGGDVELLSLSAPIGGEASCR